MTLFRALPFAFLLLCACAAAPQAEQPAPRVREAHASGEPALASDATAAIGGAAHAEPGAPGELQELSPELAIFKDPEFRKRFAESYSAESDIEPRLTTGERESMLQVLEHLADDKPETALELLEQISGPAASAAVDFTAANIHFAAERLEQAAGRYGTAVEKFPKFRRAWRNLGLIHVRRGEPREAARALARVIELGGGDAVVYGLLGFSYASLEDPLAAESAYRMANLLDPRTPDWRMGLARSLFRQRRFADAAALCESMLAEDPQRADLWLLQANAFLELEQPMQAAENLELLSRMGAATSENLCLLADIYINADLGELAVQTYERALERGEKPPPGRVLRAAKVLLSRGGIQDVARLLQSTETQLDEAFQPEDRKELLRLRARIAVASGASEEEASLLDEIVALDPLDGEALLLLGQHAARKGDIERAVFQYERAASLEAWEADARLRHAQLLVGQGKYNEALPLLRRSLALRPSESVQTYLEQVERVAGR